MKHFIDRNPDILGGKPVIIGTRVPISRIIFLLKEGYTIDAIQEDYPHISKDTIENAVSELVEILDTDGNASTIF